MFPDTDKTVKVLALQEQSSFYFIFMLRESIYSRTVCQPAGCIYGEG